MPRIPEHVKRDRLERIMLLLKKHPEGLREREIADELHFERRTTHNYLKELEYRGWAYKEGTLWHPLPYDRFVLRRFELQPEEVLSLYLAARLFVKRSSQRNAAAESALLKLAHSLSEDMGLGVELSEAARLLARRPVAEGHEDVFRTIMQAYLYRRKVRLVYGPHHGQSFVTVFSPYLLEPSPIGFAIYAIGYSSAVDALRSYKLKRIREAHLLRETYNVPTDFPGLELLHRVCPAGYGEDAVRITLRFSPAVAHRVLEAAWPPSQQAAWDQTNEGYLLVSFDVVDTADVLPWIRGWGAACEVLEPETLRNTLTAEAQQLAHLYG